MRVIVDYQRCEGHGLCEKTAPDLFELDEQGFLIAKFEGRDIPPELEDAARDAVGVCPVAALAIDGDA